MTKKEFLEKSNIKMDYGNDYYPAKEGRPRSGRIRKEMEIYSPSDLETSKSDYAVLGVDIDTWEKTFSVCTLLGPSPNAEKVFWALLADRDIRRLIVEYQNTAYKEFYKVWSSKGYYGSKNFYITTGTPVDGFAVTRTKKICHISMYGKLNENFGDTKSPIYIGDFVKLAIYLGLTEDLNVKSLRKKATVKYVFPMFVEELADFSTEIPKLL